MDRAKPTLLLTRPEPAARRFAADARARLGDVRVVISPATRIAFRDAALPERDFGGVIFTSENAVLAFGRLATAGGMRAWCVGPRTAEAAVAAGFEVRSGPGEAAGLAAAILAQPVAGPLLWPRGAEAAFDIAERLNSAGLETIPVTLYAQERQAPTAEARALLAGSAPVVLPLFSPRGARELATWGAPAAPLRIVAISPAVAEAAKGLSPLPPVVAARPDAGAMLAAVAGIFAACASP